MKIEVPVELPEGIDREKTTGFSAEYGGAVGGTVNTNYKNWVNNSVGYIITSGGGGGGGGSNSNGLGKGSGTGSGSGIGSGSGSGSGNGTVSAVSEVVNVSSGNATIDTSVSSTSVSNLPKGTEFASLLKVAPNLRPQGQKGGFSIDGSSGSENVFVVGGQEVSNFRTGNMNKKSSDDEITSSIANLPRPEIPQKAKWAKKDSSCKCRFFGQ